MELNFFDNVAIIIVALSVIFGALKGAVKTSLDILAFIATIVLTMWLLPYSYELFSEHMNGALRTGLGLVVCYIFSLIVVSLSSKNVKHFVDPVSGGYIDRIGGIGIGLIRAWLIIASIFISITIMYDKTDIKDNSFAAMTKEGYQNNAKWLTSATSYNLVSTMTDILLYVMPSSIKDKKFKDFELYNKLAFVDKDKKPDSGNENQDLQLNEDLQKALKYLKDDNDNAEKNIKNTPKVQSK
ncbi:MAG: CvpA family protein [Rickettsiaceae bacterium]|nr:CvpA family protein [Rickettsiaceae bacterium]